MPAKDFYVDIYKHLLSPPEPGSAGDVALYIPELGPHEGVAYYCDLSYDVDGTYYVYAQVDSDENVSESNENNNIGGPKEVVIYADADLDRDGDVDGADLAILAAAFGSDPSDSNFNYLCDFILDSVIDENDLAVFVPHFGRQDCPCVID